MNTHEPAHPARAGRGMSPTQWVLVLSSLLLVSMATGCGNAVDAQVTGMAAMAVDGDGNPVVVVVVCRDHVDTVTIVGGREGLGPDEPNPEVGSWTASEPQTGTFTVSLAEHGPEWTGPASVDLDDDELYIAGANRSDADVEVTQVTFRGREVAALAPDEVIVRDGDVWTRTKLDDMACEA